MREESGETVEIAFIDQGYTGEDTADAAGWRVFAGWLVTMNDCPKTWLVYIT